jgi:hypothetical protein
MNTQKVTQDALLDRTVSAMTEAIAEADNSDTWIKHMAQHTLLHLAAELIALEELAGKPLSLQDAAHFLCSGVKQ